MPDFNAVKNFMRDRGLIGVIFNDRGSYYGYPDEDKNSYAFKMKTEVLKNEAVTNIIIENISDPQYEGIADNVLTNIFKHAENAELDLGLLPFWKKHIESIASVLIEDSVTDSSIYNGYKDYAIFAAKMLDDFNWKALFERVFKIQKCTNYPRQSFKTILKEYASSNPESFKAFVDEEVFFSKGGKPSYASRGCLYSEYISAGFLNKKTARKIRSEASEETSLVGLKSLVENKELYSNYDELILQFTDSKYESVVAHLADTLPEYLITSIMGTEFYWAKRKLEARLEQIERDRAANSQMLSGVSL